jgi:hypothetical protein
MPFFCFFVFFLKMPPSSWSGLNCALLSGGVRGGGDMGVYGTEKAGDSLWEKCVCDFVLCGLVLHFAHCHHGADDGKSL